MKKSNKEEKEKIHEYASELIRILGASLDDNEIEVDEESFTEFMYALGVLVPHFVYTKMSGRKIDALQFNHLMNTLCFQYVEMDENTKEV